MKPRSGYAEGAVRAISGMEYSSRLARLCLDTGGRGLPRKRLDRQILFRSVLFGIDRSRAHAEAEMDALLLAWLGGPGRNLDLDHVSLRRELVDEGYLVRDPGGAAYRAGEGPADHRFEAAVDTLDPALIVEEEFLRRVAKKKSHLQGRR